MGKEEMRAPTRNKISSYMRCMCCVEQQKKGWKSSKEGGIVDKDFSFLVRIYISCSCNDDVNGANLSNFLIIQATHSEPSFLRVSFIPHCHRRFFIVITEQREKLYLERITFVSQFGLYEEGKSFDLLLGSVEVFSWHHRSLFFLSCHDEIVAVYPAWWWN